MKACSSVLENEGCGGMVAESPSHYFTAWPPAVSPSFWLTPEQVAIVFSFCGVCQSSSPLESSAVLWKFGMFGKQLCQKSGKRSFLQ